MVIISLIKGAYNMFEESNKNAKNDARRRYSLPPNASEMHNYQPYQAPPSYPEYTHARQGEAPPLMSYNSTETQQQAVEWDEDAIEYNEKGKRVIPGTHYTTTSIKEMITGGDPKELATVIVFAVILVIIILMFVFEHQIVKWLEPVSDKLKGNSWGWLVPTAVMIVLSIPPLFGHDIVLILVGVIWKLWPGFGIAAFGTVVGEVVTWFFIRFFFLKKSYNAKENNLRFATMSRLCVEGGFIIIFILRMSFIPGHFTTAVFAVSGVSFWVYFAVAILTTPKLLVNVLIGANFDNTGSKSSQKISKIFLIVMIVITVLATIYVRRQLHGVRKVLIAEARERTLARRNGKKDGTTV